MNRRSSTGRGFTLVEMLTATAMVAVLAGSLYASLHIAFKARDSAVRSVELVRKCNLAAELLKGDIASAAVPNGVLAGAFVGASGGDAQGSGTDTLTFYAVASDIEPAPGVGDIKKVEYSCELAADSSGLVLMRRVTVNLLAPRTPEPIQEVLCRGVSAFVLRYFDGTTWQNGWDSTTKNNILPIAVEVTIELSGDRLSAPPASRGYRMTRVLPIPCGQIDTAETSSSGTGVTP